MTAVYQITAYWDENTGRWTAVSDDIPGLVVEAKDFKQLSKNVSELAPQLLELNGDGGGDIPINITAQHSMRVGYPMAAE
ncbi:MAG: DUF1902 domain-containing protein [Rhodospirillales bacterium]|nr:DUF1902 domain-containing protein [Rhodospirillales bacterium]MCB9995412.1 DUF1902 domain-containing protein [Rhodospirillales bacterium]